MRTRHLLVIVCVAAAVFAPRPSVVEARPVADGGVATGASEIPARANAPVPPVSLGGIGGTGFRRVADVLRQSTVGRGRAAASPDPTLALVADDPAAFVDSTGRLLYIDQFGVAPADGTTPVPGPIDGAAAAIVGAADGRRPGPVPASGETPASSPDVASATEPPVAQGVALPPGNTFLLNSRPGSTKTIFLDFDGYTVAGTAWNAQTGIGSQTVAPYDYDGIAGRSATDELYIRAIWQAVADDYAAFDVNVTTQQPTDDALFRSSAGDTTYGSIAVITPDKWMPSVCGSGCGGVAYVGVFGQINDEYYSPAWVFASSSQPWTSVVDTASHEVGHNLGLSHDGTSGGGCPTSSYFGGNGSGVGSWGPIMGSPYGRQYSQWSRGEYTCANQLQDDVAIIGARTGFVPDESSSFGNAVAIPTNELPTADQIIGFAGDVDYFRISVSGYLKVALTRTTNGSSLYPRFAILNSSGTELASAFLTSTTSGVLELTSLSPGTYYVSVTGFGLGTPQTGFSNYASFGYYNVSAQLGAPSIPGSPTLTATGSNALTASWSASTGTGAITYAVTLCESVSVVCTSPIDTSTTSVTLTPPTPTGSYFARINARQVPGGVSANATTAAVAVLTAPIAPAPVRLVFNDAADTVIVVWAGEQEFAPVSVTGRTMTVVNRSTGLPILTQSVPASGSLAFSTALANVWLDASFVSQTVYGPPWASSPPSPIGSVFLGRLPAPQAAGPAPGPRPNSPQSPPAAVVGRLPAPQV